MSDVILALEHLRAVLRLVGAHGERLAAHGLCPEAERRKLITRAHVFLINQDLKLHAGELAAPAPESPMHDPTAWPAEAMELLRWHVIAAENMAEDLNKHINDHAEHREAKALLIRWDTERPAPPAAEPEPDLSTADRVLYDPAVRRYRLAGISLDVGDQVEVLLAEGRWAPAFWGEHGGAPLLHVPFWHEPRYVVEPGGAGTWHVRDRADGYVVEHSIPHQAEAQRAARALDRQVRGPTGTLFFHHVLYAAWLRWPAHN